MPQESETTLVVHHDDLGASWSANRAFVELFDLGIATAGSVMVPCPWFPDLVAIARQRRDLDIGVHLTLTAEFERFRWRPLTGVGNGLTDADGFMWATTAAARAAPPEAVERELRAQVETALAAGIDVTHLDAHMGTAWQPEFVEVYERLGRDYRLPIVLTRDVSGMAPAGTDYQPVLDRQAARANPDIVRFLLTPFGDLAPTAASYRAIFARAVQGLNYGAFHFAKPGDIELYSDDASTRIAEYEFFRSGEAKSLLDDMGIRLCGMRTLRDQLRRAG